MPNQEIESTVIPTPPGTSEIVEARGRSSKLFQTGVNSRRAVSMIRTVHVPDDVPAWEQGGAFTWLNPDETIVKRVGVASIKNAWYILRASVIGPLTYEVESKRDGGILRFTLLSADGIPASDVKPIISGGRITYQDAIPGIDIILIPVMGRLQAYKRLKDATSPRSLVWLIEQSTDTLRYTRSWGRDNADKADAGRSIEPLLRNVRREIDLQTTIEPLSPIGNVRRERLTELWTGDVFRLDTQRRKIRSSEAIYPIEIDPDITESIGADLDDVTETANALDQSSGDYLFHYYYGGHQQTYYDNQGGLRFTTLGVDQADTIDLANLKISLNRVTNTGSNNNTTVSADDVDDAPAWSQTDRPTQITPTTANVDIGTIHATTGRKTIDVTAIVQEIVDRGGWASNNDIRFAMLGASEAGNYGTFDWDDYAATKNTVATLEVDFTAGGPATRVQDLIGGGLVPFAR